MNNSSEVFSVDLNWILTPKALVISFVALVIAYAVVRAVAFLTPAPIRVNIPRLSWLDILDFKNFGFRPIPDVVDHILEVTGKAGVQAIEHPRYPSFFVWDIDYVQNAVKKPSAYPAYLCPPEEPAGNLLTSSFIVGNHDHWKTLRRVVKPLLTKVWRPGSFHAAAKRLIAKLEKKQHVPIDCFQLLERAIAEVIYEALFGISAKDDFFGEGQEGDEFLRGMEFVLAYATKVSPWLGITAMFPWYRKDRQKFYSVLRTLDKKIRDTKDSLIASIPDYTKAEDDFEIFPRLIDAWEKGDLPENALLMDVCFLFAGGQASTATLLVVALYHLGRNQELQDELRSEIMKTFDGEVPETITEMGELKLCRATLDESLRIAPPLSFTVGNVADEDAPIGQNSYLPKGSILYFCLHQMHRNPEYFENPRKFDPHRWLTDDSEKLAKMKKAFRPFGFGEPSCPGQTLSRAEALTMLSTILKKFRVRVSPKTDFEEGQEPFQRIHSVLANISGIYLEFEEI